MLDNFYDCLDNEYARTRYLAQKIEACFSYTYLYEGNKMVNLNMVSESKVLGSNLDSVNSPLFKFNILRVGPRLVK